MTDSRRLVAAATKLLKKVNMEYAIPLLLADNGAGFETAPAPATRFSEGLILGGVELPAEMDELVLLFVLLPNLIPIDQREEVPFGTAPTFVSFLERMDHVVKVFDSLVKLFGGLLVSNAAYNFLLLSPRFRINMYRLWYDSPIEGLDGRPNPNLIRGSEGMEIPRAIPGYILKMDEDWNSTGRLNSIWYKVFLRTVMFNYYERFKSLAVYRAQMLATLRSSMLGGNTPNIITIGPISKKDNTKRNFKKGLYVGDEDSYTNLLKLADVFIQLLGKKVESPQYLKQVNDIIYNAPDFIFLSNQNGMFAPGLVEALLGHAKNPTTGAGFDKMFHMKKYVKYVGPARFSRFRNELGDVEAALDIEVVRVPTVMRPQAFFVHMQSPISVLVKNRSEISVLEEDLQSLDNYVPESLLIWDKPMTLNLPINETNIGDWTEEEEEYLKPTIFNVSTIQRNVNINIDFVRLADPFNTLDVLVRLTKTNLESPHATSRFHRQPQIKIMWGLVLIGPHHDDVTKIDIPVMLLEQWEKAHKKNKNMPFLEIVSLPDNFRYDLMEPMPSYLDSRGYHIIELKEEEEKIMGKGKEKN